LRKKRSTQLLRECWSFLTKLMTCQNLQNKLLNITVLLLYLVFVGEFKKKCHSPNMTSSISFWWVLVLVHSPFWQVFEKNSFPHWSHMSFYMCFDWFKKLRSFSNVWNLKMDVVLKALRAVVIRWFSLNEAPLGLFKFISDFLPYFEKINIFFNITTKKVWINL
jgi:hypothetical protein